MSTPDNSRYCEVVCGRSPCEYGPYVIAVALKSTVTSEMDGMELHRQQQEQQAYCMRTYPGGTKSIVKLGGFPLCNLPNANKAAYEFKHGK